MAPFGAVATDIVIDRDLSAAAKDAALEAAMVGGGAAIGVWAAGVGALPGAAAGEAAYRVYRVGRAVYRAREPIMAAGRRAAEVTGSVIKSGIDKAGDWARRIGCGCFVAGTLVATAEGLTPIEDIQVGDKVWARSEDTGELALKPVTGLLRPPERVIWEVTFEIDEGTGVHSEQFEVTDDHPWGRPDGTWLRTDELEPGTEILRAHDAPARVVSVVQTERTAQTYNFEVAEFHTYFVGEAEVWVHNAKNCDISPLQAQGKAFEEQVAAEMRADGWDVAREVTLETPGGARTRMDIAGTRDGITRCVECKSSATAPLTPGQVAAHPQIGISGATVMGRGKPNVPGGTTLPPTTVEVVRP